MLLLLSVILPRPIDLHLKGFKHLGAKVDMDHGFVEATTEKLVGNKLYLDFPSLHFL